MNIRSESGQSFHQQRWYQRAPRIPTLALFAVVALALLGTFALILATVNAERIQREQAVRTSGIIATLGTIVRATMSGETGQRGYFITSDTRYLAPYLEGRRNIPQEWHGCANRWAMICRRTKHNC